MTKTEQTLSELYALRAGLSIISEEKDKVDKIKKKTDADVAAWEESARTDVLKFYHYEYRSGEFTYDDMSIVWGDWYTHGKTLEVPEEPRDTSAIRENPAGVDQLLLSGRFQQDIERHIEQTNDKLKKAKAQRSCAYVLTSVMIILMIAGLGALAFLAIGHFAMHMFDRKIFIYSAVGCGVFVVGCFLLSRFVVGILRWRTKRRVNAGQKALDEYFPELEEIAADGARKLGNCGRAKQQANTQIVPHKKSCDEMYSTLVRTYAKTLDPRDWKYVDLIIFYFETGRALDMRDALQQLDRERQTKEIVGAVQEATSLICNTIRSEMSSLRSTIESGFATLSSNIRSLQGSIESGFAEMNAIGRAQLDEARLGNALRAKANATSEQLMNDVHYMRGQMYY